ncbi:uncharacterized protein AB675_3113 [Cyphellophora attinorum]|uniref:Uncharacterized protein n=1 Tax=Cyphellophora attinorum TaxID=1664694 RepID=A0A0N1NZV5_9EURO|nr:uncharacterized protein AB675_3113 [Phialophora attinorum]KPI37986.1 hypothetical protein AB675_3113 [Phialophora attinorum]
MGTSRPSPSIAIGHNGAHSLTSLPVEIQRPIYQYLFTGRRFKRYIGPTDTSSSSLIVLTKWKNENRKKNEDGTLVANPVSVFFASKDCYTMGREALFKHGIIDATEVMMAVDTFRQKPLSHPLVMSLKEVRHLHIDKDCRLRKFNVFDGMVPHLKSLRVKKRPYDFGFVLAKFEDGQVAEDEGQDFAERLEHALSEDLRNVDLVYLLRHWSQRAPQIRLVFYSPKMTALYAHRSAFVSETRRLGYIGDLYVEVDFSSGFIHAVPGDRAHEDRESWSLIPFDVSAFLARLSQSRVWRIAVRADGGANAEKRSETGKTLHNACQRLCDK